MWRSFSIQLKTNSNMSEYVYIEEFFDFSKNYKKILF